MSEEDKRKIERLMKETAPKPTSKLRSTRKTPKAPDTSPTINVSGSNNVTAGRDVHIHHGAKEPPPKPEIRPGIDHVSIEQRAILKKLVEEIAETEARLKRNARGYAAVYSALFRQFPGVHALAAIPLGGFEIGRSYLNQQLGRLNSMKTAPIKNGNEWRSKKIKYIKLNSKAPDDEAAMRAYMIRNFGAESLTKLANDELERVYRYVAGRRSRAK